MQAWWRRSAGMSGGVRPLRYSGEPTTAKRSVGLMRTATSDLAAHFELPYMKEFVAALPEMLEGEMDLRRCAMVSKVAA